MKKLLQQLHIMLKAINYGTLVSFSLLNFKDLSNLNQKQDEYYNI